MPRSTSCANSAPMPVYGRLTPTLTSCAWAHEVVRASAAVAAMIIHFVMRVPPRRARMGRILWQKPETAQARGRKTCRRVLCDNAPAGRRSQQRQEDDRGEVQGGDSERGELHGAGRGLQAGDGSAGAPRR